MPRVTFYGHFSGWSSYPTVCRAIAKWLWIREVNLEICDLRGAEANSERDNGPTPPELYTGVDNNIPKVEVKEIKEIKKRSRILNEGYPVRAPRKRGVSLLFGFPEWAEVIPRHEKKIGYHVGDVDRVPQRWVATMNSEDVVLTPSSWCKEVFTKCGVTSSIHVVQHGVAIQKNAEPSEVKSSLRFRHFSSGSSSARKGTRELLAAMDTEEESPLRNCIFGIHVGDEELWQKMRHGSWPTRGLRADRWDEPMPPPHMEERWFPQTDVLVQPSRAEGFGLIPLEGLAAGLPVVMTLCTGHAEYATETTPGVIAVPTGENTPCGGPGRAPSIKSGDLQKALEQAIQKLAEVREAAQSNAERIRKEWSWDAALSRSCLLDILKV